MTRIGLVGCGRMGCTLSSAFLQRGSSVVMCSRREPVVVRKQIQARMAKGVGETEAHQIADRLLHCTQKVADLRSCEFIIENVPEDFESKAEILETLASICDSRAILASNTSSLPPHTLAERCPIPDRLVFAHFFNPPDVLTLVEVACTSEEAIGARDATLKFLGEVGFDPVVVPPTPGFVVNRILSAALYEAFRLQTDAGITPETIDYCVTHGTSMTKGLLETADRIGLATVLEMLRNILGTERFLPHDSVVDLLTDSCK